MAKTIVTQFGELLNYDKHTAKDERTVDLKNDAPKHRADYEEAKNIESSPHKSAFESKSDKLKKQTAARDPAAIDTKKNDPKREQTCYFKRSQLKREAARVAKKKSVPKKTKAKDKKKPGLE